MKNSHLQFIALFVAAVGVAAPFAPSALAQTSVAAPAIAAKQSLEVQISASMKDGKNVLILDPVQPHLSVTLRNVSDKPIQLFEEWNSWGYGNLHFEITAVNEQTLPQVLIVQKGAQSWLANYASTETLRPGQALVREAYLHVPADIRHPETPATLKELNQDLNAQGSSYHLFPFPNPFEARRRQAKTVTMKAVFEVEPQDTAIPGVWTGRVESAPLTYEIHWRAPRR